MKKLLLSAIAMIAFTATSFASQASKAETIIGNAKVQEFSLSAIDDTLKNDDCITITITVTTTRVVDGPLGYEVFISVRTYRLVLCD